MSIMRFFGSPVRRYFNQHFEMVKEEVRKASVTVPDPAIAQISGQVHQIVMASRETQVFVARQLGEMLGRIEDVEARSADLAERVEGVQQTSDRVRQDVAARSGEISQRLEWLQAELPAMLTPPIPNGVADVSARDALLLNRLNTHDGYLSQAGLWVNDPLSRGWDEDGLDLQDVNERIGELPFVFARLGQLRPPARVLDVGSCESTVALSLASLGYDTTALDPRPYRFEHSRLEIVTSGIEEFSPSEPFDAVVVLSTIEHLGLGSYGLRKGERQDLRAMRHIQDLVRPGGLLVLTTPFGAPNVDELERTYDVAGITELIEGFTLEEEPTVLVRISRTEWGHSSEGFADATDDRQRVVMLSARRRET